MSVGTRLTQKEQGKIEALRNEGYSYREIAKKIKRSASVVHNYLKLGNKYGLKREKGRKSSVSAVLKKKIISLASSKLLSSKAIKAELQLEQSTRTIRRVLNQSPSLVYKKFKLKPPLSKTHIKARLEFAEESVRVGRDWSKIIWSDEKKFNLDGPDGIRYYWHDLRNEQHYLSRRAFGGGTLMVWGAFFGEKLLDLIVCEHTLDSKKYIDVLNKSLLPSMSRELKFMHDGASFHRSKLTTGWLKKKKIETIKWPANSPDLNPLENIWGSLTRAVYASGRQFKNKNELKEEIMKQWSLIKPEELSKNVKSMTARIIEIIRKNGGNTKY